MVRFFLGVFEISAGVSLFVLALLLVLRLAGKKFTSRCRYVLWTLVLLRLAIPISFNILPAMIEIPVSDGTETNVQLQEEQPNDTASTPSVEEDRVPEGDGSTTVVLPGVTVTVPTEPTDPVYPTDPITPPADSTVDVQPPTPEQVIIPDNTDAETPTEPKEPVSVLRILEIAAVIYFAGAVIFFLWNMLSYIIYSRRILRSARNADAGTIAIFLSVCDKENLKKVPVLLVSPGINSPAAFGLFSRKIVLPDITFTQNGLAGTLFHEVVHCKRGDLYIKVIELIARSLHWFNPISHIAAFKCEMEMEMSCDEAVLAGCSDEARGAYGEVMLDIIRRCRRNRGALTTHFNPRKSSVKARFANIINGSGSCRGKVLIPICLVLCLLAGTIVACNVGDKPGEGVTEEYNIITVIDEKTQDDKPRKVYIVELDIDSEHESEINEAVSKIFLDRYNEYLADETGEYMHLLADMNCDVQGRILGITGVSRLMTKISQIVDVRSVFYDFENDRICTLNEFMTASGLTMERAEAQIKKAISVKENADELEGELLSVIFHEDKPVLVAHIKNKTEAASNDPEILLVDYETDRFCTVNTSYYFNGFDKITWEDIPVILSVASPTEEMLASANEIIDVSTDEYGAIIALTSNIDVDKLKITEIVYDSELKIADLVPLKIISIKGDEPVLIKVSFPCTLSYRGITYVDINGYYKRFEININGEDGTPIIAEIDPKRYVGGFDGIDTGLASDRNDTIKIKDTVHSLEDGGIIYYTGDRESFMPPEATYLQTEIPIGSYTLYGYTSADSMPCMYLEFEVDGETYALLKTKFEEPGISVNPYFYIQELRIVDENTALATLNTDIFSSKSWELTYSLSTGNINAESEPNEHTTPVWKLIDVKEKFHPEMVGNPNESAATIFYHRLSGTDYYLSFNAIRYRNNTQSGFTYKLPYDYKVYYVNSNDTTRIGYIDAKLPAEIEYDSVTPVYAFDNGGVGGCRFYLKLTKGEETFYVEFNNLAHIGSGDYLKFDYAYTLTADEFIALTERYPDITGGNEADFNFEVEIEDGGDTYLSGTRAKIYIPAQESWKKDGEMLVEGSVKRMVVGKFKANYSAADLREEIIGTLGYKGYEISTDSPIIGITADGYTYIGYSIEGERSKGEISRRYMFCVLISDRLSHKLEVWTYAREDEDMDSYFDTVLRPILDSLHYEFGTGTLHGGFINAYKEAEYRYSLFTAYSSLAYSEGTTEYNGQTYQRYSECEFTNLAEMREVLLRYFSEELTDTLLNTKIGNGEYPLYIEQDGKLYRFGGYAAQMGGSAYGYSWTPLGSYNGEYYVEVRASGDFYEKRITLSRICKYIIESDGSIRFTSFPLMYECLANEFFNPSAESTEDYRAYISVFEDETALYCSSTGEKMLLSEYLLGHGYSVQKYTVVDIDDDTLPEAVLWIDKGMYKDYGTLVLNYEDGVVYSFGFAYRQLYGLKADGSFHWSGGISHNGNAKLTFNGADVMMNNILYHEESATSGERRYYVGEEEVDREEYEKAVELEGAKEDAEWIDFDYRAVKFSRWGIDLSVGTMAQISVPSHWEAGVRDDSFIFRQSDTQKGDYGSYISRIWCYRTEKTFEQIKSALEATENSIGGSIITSRTNSGYPFSGVYQDNDDHRKYVFHITAEDGFYIIEITRWNVYDGESFENEIAIPIVQSFSLEYSEPVTITDIADWETLPWRTDGLVHSQNAYNFINNLVSGESDIPEYNGLGITDYSITLLEDQTAGFATLRFTFTVTGNSLPETLPPGTYTKLVYDGMDVSLYDEEVPDEFHEYEETDAKEHGLDKFGDEPAVLALHKYFCYMFGIWEVSPYGEWDAENYYLPYNYITAFYGDESMVISFTDAQRLLSEKFGIAVERLDRSGMLSRCEYDSVTDTIRYADTRGNAPIHRFIDVTKQDGVTYVTVQLYADRLYLVPSHKVQYMMGENIEFIGYRVVEFGKYEPREILDDHVHAYLAPAYYTTFRSTYDGKVYHNKYYDCAECGYTHYSGIVLCGYQDSDECKGGCTANQ